MSTALHERCDACGRRENTDEELLVFTFGGYAGYGSVHDGEYIGLHICSECLDRMLSGRPDTDADGS